jgi:hypothetical protein
MHLVERALSRAGDALRWNRVARDDHGAGCTRSIIGFAEQYGRRRYSIAETEMQGVPNPAITDGEPLLIEGSVTRDPTCESAVGGPNFRAIRADEAAQVAGWPLQSAASR